MKAKRRKDGEVEKEKEEGKSSQNHLHQLTHTFSITVITAVVKLYIQRYYVIENMSSPSSPASLLLLFSYLFLDVEVVLSLSSGTGANYTPRSYQSNASKFLSNSIFKLSTNFEFSFRMSFPGDILTI